MMLVLSVVIAIVASLSTSFGRSRVFHDAEIHGARPETYVD